MYFLALSHAPPPEVIEMATNRPVTITPSSIAPEALKAIRLAGDRVDDEVQHDRRQHRQQRRNEHLPDRGLGQHVHRAAIVRLLRALHDAGHFLELPAHFLDHRARRAADRRHRHAAEQIRQQSAEEEADHDPGICSAKVGMSMPAKYV